MGETAIQMIERGLREAKEEGFTSATWCTSCRRVVASKKGHIMMIDPGHVDCRQPAGAGTIDECLEALKNFA